MKHIYDNTYKGLFSHPKMVQELLEEFVHEDFVKDLDFATLEQLDKSFYTKEFRKKESDLIYKVRFKGRDMYIFLLIEFTKVAQNSE